jgi:peptidoglycan/xylan/chitin deacetylase (PgdA/CDA1 family)
VKPVVLTYHSLDRSGSVISIAPEQFRAQMEFLAARRIPVVPLGDIRNTPGGVALTFDDGFDNFYTEAFPVLQALHFPATVFAVSNYCGLPNRWPSQPDIGIPPLNLMSRERLAEIGCHGISVAAHTATHPRLSTLPVSQVRDELKRSKAMIEDCTGRPADALAYPYGDSNAAVRRIAAEFFRTAYGTTPEFLSDTSHPMNLPRVDMYYLRNPLWFESVGRIRGRAYIALRRSLRAVRHGVMS